MTGTLRVATYNLHGGVGRGRRRDGERMTEAIHALGAQVIGLQEVDSRAGDLDHLAGSLGLRALAGANIVRHGFRFGNALLTAHPVLEHRPLDLSVGRSEPRGALLATLEVDGRALRVVVTHLGLRRVERAAQVGRLVEALAEGPPAPTLFLGDFNAWGRDQQLLENLGHPTGRHLRPATFPSRWPFLALDRLWATGGASVASPRVLRAPLFRAASDHLPLVGSVAWDGPDG